MQRSRESGQAIMLMVAALGLVLLGGMGFAIDASQLFGHRQMAQTAADATAEAAILDILGGTNTGTNAFGSGAFTCANGSDVRAPCSYARLNGFGTTGTSDTIAVDFPGSVTGVTLSPSFTPAAVHVVITRPVTTTLLRLLGAGASSNIKAAATAAIVEVVAPIPILVTHPSLSNALRMSGSPNITICGGPQRSIQVNSTSLTALSVGGSAVVDLSKSGPADTLGNCTAGTGSDFGVRGGPASAGLPGWLSPTGTTEHYLQPALPVSDPLKDVNPPAQPATNCGAGCKAPLANGVSGCPASPGKPCQLYAPGYYPNGLEIKNETAVFSPGLYYMDGSKGFSNAANGNIYMCTTCPADTVDTKNTGMLVFLSKNSGPISLTSNSSATLVGSSLTSNYKAMLFFVARDSPAQTHILGGGGDISLTGTIYATNTTMSDTLYQTVSLRGNSGSNTLIKGEIVVSVLNMGGNSGITMQLDPNYVLPVDQVALVK